MLIRKIEIHNIMSYVNAVFDLGHNNVIVGPNNSGKTNLLRILQMLQSEQIEQLKLPAESRHKNAASQLSMHLELTGSESKFLEQVVFNDPLEGSEQIPGFSKVQVVITWMRPEARGEEVPAEVILRMSNGITIVYHRGDRCVFYTNEITLNDEPINVPDPTKPQIYDQHQRAFGFEHAKIFTAEGRQILSSTDAARQCFMIRKKDCSIKHDFNLDPSRNPHVLQSDIYDYVGIEKTRNVRISIFSLIDTFVRKGVLIADEILPAIDTLANDLFEMKNKKEADYESMKESFSEIFPGVQIEVKDIDGQPKRILVRENGRSFPLESSSSGYFKTLYVLYQMHDKKDRSMFFDELETHLHPAQIRRMARHIDRYGTDGHDTALPQDSGGGEPLQESQTTIITHSPALVTHSLLSDPSRRLFYIKRENGHSTAHTAPSDFRMGVKAGLFNPNIFFDRCVVLVEGPSDEYAMRGLSDRCDDMLGKNGITLVNVGGKHNISPYMRLLDGYGIPCVAMVDSDCNMDRDYVVKLQSDLEAEARSYGYLAEANQAKMTAETAYEFMSKAADEEKLKEGALYRVLQKAEDLVKAQ